MSAPSPEEAAALAAEIAKLGPNASARVQAVEAFLSATRSPDHAKQIMSGIVTAAQVEGLERTMAFRARPAPSPPSTTRPAEQAPGQGRVTDEQWQRMSHAERLNYARQFPQQPFWNEGSR